MHVKAFLPFIIAFCATQVLALDFTNSKWIWTNEVDSAGNAPAGSRAFRRDFYSPQGKTALSANIIITSDNGYTLWVNGNAVGSGHDFHQADAYCIRLAPDCNVFAVNATNDLTVPNPADGFTDTIVTDGTWHAFTSVPSGFQFSDFDDESWPAATVQGNYGIGPWNAVAIPQSASTTPLALSDSNWIWTNEVKNGVAPVSARTFRKSIALPQGRRVTSATVLLRVDDAYTLYVQGRVVGSGTNWQATQRYVVDIQPPASDFTIALYGANNGGGPAGIAAAVELKMEDCECGSIISFVTDSSWKYSTNTTAGFQNPGFDDSKWSNAIVESQYKTASWGNTPAPTKLTPPSAALAGAPAANAAIVVT